VGGGRKQRLAHQNARALLAENVYMLMIDPLYVVSGFGVGLLVGMTGVGGGSLMTPLLILLFGIHPATAVGTDLLYAAATKTGGSVAHGWARSIYWPAVIRLASGSSGKHSGAVCTENSNPDVMMVKPTEDRV
jgi:uncharacterized membrane protein YfcA